MAIGLAVGLEREHSAAAGGAAESPAESGATRDTVALGARTFALVAALGWALGFAGQTWAWLPPVGLVVVGALIAIQYITSADRGLTTEFAAMITFVLGLLVNVNRSLTVALALVTILLLVSKPFVWTVVSRIRRAEITATIQLAILLAIVLPILPAEPVDPWGILPPQKIGLFVVLIAGIGFVGYLLSRMFGARRGAGLTGLVGGLTSSTAVTVAMSKIGRDPNMREPGRLAVFLANAVMFARVIVVTLVLSREVAAVLVVPMGAMGLVMVVGALRSWRAISREAGGDDTNASSPPIKNPFELIPALKWGAVLCVVLVVAHFGQEWFDELGLYAAALASGLADVDAITIAVANQASASTLAVDAAALAISIAVVSNTVVKGSLAVVAGGRGFGRAIAVFFGIAIAVGLLVALVV